MSRCCIYPGSFDPFTLGHLQIVRRAADLFDQVVVAVLQNRSKQCAFTVEERVAMIADSCAQLPNVKVQCFDGLLADFAAGFDHPCILRGIRSSADFESEYPMAVLNRQLGDGLETVFLPALPEYMHISSSAVREIASFGGDISVYIPACILRRVEGRFGSVKKE